MSQPDNEPVVDGSDTFDEAEYEKWLNEGGDETEDKVAEEAPANPEDVSDYDYAQEDPEDAPSEVEDIDDSEQEQDSDPVSSNANDVPVADGDDSSTAVVSDPTPVAETKAAVKQDAAFRGWRTLLQGLATDVVVAIIVILVAVLPGINSPDDIQWAVIGFSIAKSVVVAIVSYFVRLLGIGSSTVSK